MATGRDSIHNTVTRWPGWTRLKGEGIVGGVAVSRYAAPLIASTAIALDSTQLPVQWEPEAREAAEALLWGLTKAQQALRPSTKVHDCLVKLPGRRAPFHHQWQMIEACRLLKWRVLLADDMGLGKTATALWCLHDSGARNTLIVTPVSIKWNWQREFNLALGDSWETLVIDGTPKQRANQFVEFQRLMASDAKVALIINYDLLLHVSDLQLEVLRLFVQDEMLICDESHYLKNRRSGRTHVISDLANTIIRHKPKKDGTRGRVKHRGRGAKFRLLLTGTPILNLVDDVYSQIDIINPGTWTSWWDFSQRHLKTIPIGKRDKVVGTKNLQELNAVVNCVQLGRDKDDVLNLPPQVHTYPELTLDEPSRRVYKMMRDHARIVLDELDPNLGIFQPEAGSAREVLMRLEQIAQGFVGGVPEPLIEKMMPLLTKRGKAIPGRPKEVMFPDHPKVTWTLQALEQLLKRGKHPVVFSRFLAPMEWLSRQFPDHKVGVLQGKLKAAEKSEMLEAFEDRGELDLLFIQVKIAEGFNLNRCQDQIFYGRDWSPQRNRQAESRSRRIGSKGTLNVQIPIVRGTVEVLLHSKLLAKDADAEQALRFVTIAELKEHL